MDDKDVPEVSVNGAYYYRFVSKDFYNRVMQIRRTVESLGDEVSIVLDALDLNKEQLKQIYKVEDDLYDVYIKLTDVLTYMKPRIKPDED